PIGWSREVFKAFRLATGEGPELPRLIGYHAVRKDLASTYKQILIKLVSPQMLLSLSARLFSTYYDTGRFEVLESRAGYVRVLMSQCTGWDANMWTEIKGSCVAFLEVAGAVDVALAAVDGA